MPLNSDFGFEATSSTGNIRTILNNEVGLHHFTYGRNESCLSERKRRYIDGDEQDREGNRIGSGDNVFVEVSVRVLQRGIRAASARVSFRFE